MSATQQAPKHFLDVHELDSPTLRRILDLGAEIKRDDAPGLLAGKTLAMIFEKPSTRTRVSFQVGMTQLGGNVIVLGENETQLGRGETPADTARVLSRYVDAIMIRTDASAKLREIASHATVPVINGLTDDSHPCQVMADIMTFEEHRGPIKGKTVAWVGDGNNMAASWVHAAVRFRFKLNVASPPELSVARRVVDWAESEQGHVKFVHDPDEAVTGADAVVTDTWVSMGDDGERDRRLKLLERFRVDSRLMGYAEEKSLFMHCLPAHRGEEVTADVIDGPRSVVWDEAENRLHAQKGILAWCLDESRG